MGEGGGCTEKALRKTGCGSCRHRWAVGCPGDEMRGDGGATLGHGDLLRKRDYGEAGARVRQTRWRGEREAK